MSAGYRARLRRLELGQYEEDMIIVNPRRWYGTDMTADELAAHREAVREVALNPKGILLCYQSEDNPDPMVALFGAEEAAKLNAGRRNIRAWRPHG